MYHLTSEIKYKQLKTIQWHNHLFYDRQFNHNGVVPFSIAHTRRN